MNKNEKYVNSGFFLNNGRNIYILSLCFYINYICEDINIADCRMVRSSRMYYQYVTQHDFIFLVEFFRYNFTIIYFSSCIVRNDSRKFMISRNWWNFFNYVLFTRLISYPSIMRFRLIHGFSLKCRKKFIPFRRKGISFNMNLDNGNFII